MSKPIDEIRKMRLQTLEKIRQAGVDPYPASCERKQLIGKAREMMSQEVAVAGRARAVRGHGGIIFIDLEDISGKIQLVFKKDDLNKEQSELLKLLDEGDFLDASGKIFQTKSGEISIQVASFHLLTKSVRPLPSKWYGLKDVEERYRQRYVDLIINPELKKVLYLRSKILTEMRKFLDEKGFLEVETPVLQPMYGGASARPFVTHHNALNCDLYLRISNELYLKRLIVGGFEKVYEVCKDFRNEGIDRQHNPEFTQVEFYWAYATYKDLLKLTEELISTVLKNVLGKTEISSEGNILDFTPPFPWMYFRDLLLAETGIDIEKVKDEVQLRTEIKEKKIEVDLEGVFGLGAIFDALYKDKIRPKIKGPLFILDYPASMIALAKRKEEEPEKIASFQLVARGFELVKCYNELNDPLEQRERWRETEKLRKKGNEEAERLDEDYIRALEYGMPPVAGWGMGIDRFSALVSGVHSIKEVILFPTLRPEKEGK